MSSNLKTQMSNFFLSQSESNPINLVRLGEWDVATEDQQDCYGKSCLPPVQDFVVSLGDFTIHPEYAHDRLAKTVVNDIGEFARRIQTKIKILLKPALLLS